MLGFFFQVVWAEGPGAEAIQRVYSRSGDLNGDAVVVFVRALCAVSQVCEPYADAQQAKFVFCLESSVISMTDLDSDWPMGVESCAATQQSLLSFAALSWLGYATAETLMFPDVLLQIPAIREGILPANSFTH